VNRKPNRVPKVNLKPEDIKAKIENRKKLLDAIAKTLTQLQSERG